MWNFILWLVVFLVGLSGYLTGFAYTRKYLGGQSGSDGAFEKIFSAIWPIVLIIQGFFLVAIPVLIAWVVGFFKLVTQGPQGALEWGKYIYDEWYPGKKEVERKKKK